MGLYSVRIYCLFFCYVLSVSCGAKNGHFNVCLSKAAGSYGDQSEEYSKFSDTADWRRNFVIADSAKTYSQVKTEALREKGQIASKNLSIDSVGLLFTDIMVRQIIPYWYGTPWTFEGHTAVPNQGEIACGYFVSTTLLHAGLNVNRYKLAQQLPVHEAESLVLEDSIVIISHSTTEQIITEMYEKTVEGLYFLGFDQSHVGFLLREDAQLYVLHSNYLGPDGVAIEKIEQSAAFASYLQFYVCPLSTNESFLKYWLNNTAISVVETP